MGAEYSENGKAKMQAQKLNKI